MIQRRVLSTRTAVLAERRQVRVTCSTETLGRDDIVVMTGGIDLTAYRQNPVVLFEHSPEMPIARAVDIRVSGTDLIALAQFPSPGVSARADEIFGLIGEHIVNAASIGFIASEGEPIDPGNPTDGLRITQCELCEFSFVSIPALPDALVTERARRAGVSGRDPRTARHQALARRLEAEDRRTDPRTARHQAIARVLELEDTDPRKARHQALAARLVAEGQALVRGTGPRMHRHQDLARLLEVEDGDPRRARHQFLAARLMREPAFDRAGGNRR